MTPNKRSVLTILLLTLSLTLSLLTSLSAAAQDSGYSRGEESWARPAGGREWGAASAIYYAGDGNVWVADRCGGNRGPGSCEDRPHVDPIMLFNSEGKLIRSFGAGLFVWPHGMFVDQDDNLWVTDAAVARTGRKGNQVHKFSPDGTLLMSLGIAGVQGTGHEIFNAPNDVLVAPNGDIFVADGHSPGTDNRIVKFDKNGKYLKEWGTVGAEAGEFRVPHALAMDSAGRLFVADRANSRLQIFDQEGNHLSTWTQFGRPSDLYIDANDILYSADSESNTGDDRNPGWERGIYIGSAKTGFVTAHIPDPERNPTGTTSHAEGVTADEQGNVYGAEVSEQNIRKWTKKGN